MQLSVLPVIAATALFIAVQGKAQPQWSTKTEFCYTSYSTKKTSSVPTTTHYTTKTATKTSTKYTKTTTTVTPKPSTTSVTTTLTSTSTVAGPTSTDTATVTSTVSTAITITAPLSTATETSTVTVTTSTTTSVTSTTTFGSPDFVPIQTSLPGSSDSMQDPMAPQRRDLESIARIKSRALLARRKEAAPVCTSSLPTYPAGVSCNRYSTKTVTTTITKSQPPCTTTAKPSTVTSTTSRTVTVTSTSYPPDVTGYLGMAGMLTAGAATSTVTTTSTDSITIVPSTTTTITETTTTTTTSSDISTATAYTQCHAANVADQDPQGAYLNSVNSNTPYGYLVTNSQTTLDCCIACATNPTCAVWILLRGSTASCYVITLNTCPSGQASSDWFINNSGLTTPSYAYGNGNCGKIDSIAS